MTGKEALKQAMELMLVPAESLLDYTAFALPILNGLLPELYSVNELACRGMDMAEGEIPTLRFVGDLQEEIPLLSQVAVLLPVGICVHLAAEDDDQRKSYFEDMYERQKKMVSLTAAEPVKDVYC